MTDEAETGSSGASDRRRHSGRSVSEQSPLQARAQFLKNRSWELVVSLNRAACARGGAQHGKNWESFGEVQKKWVEQQKAICTLAETIEFLRGCHKWAPFLFFNGNTFAEVGRTILDFVLADLPASRRREATSAVAHYIAGVLPWEPMLQIVNSLCESASFVPGDRVKTLRGSTRGVIVRIEDDGRVAWRPDGTQTELLALPESLLREKGRS